MSVLSKLEVIILRVNHVLSYGKVVYHSEVIVHHVDLYEVHLGMNW